MTKAKLSDFLGELRDLQDRTDSLLEDVCSSCFDNRTEFNGIPLEQVLEGPITRGYLVLAAEITEAKVKKIAKLRNDISAYLGRAQSENVIAALVVRNPIGAIDQIR